MKQFTLVAAILCVLGAQAAPDRSPRIINGHVSPHQPYNAYVLYLNTQNAGFFGGGTIISDRHILTSAQNIVGFVQWDIGIGSNIFVQLSMIRAVTAISHPNYNAANRLNDIGIITLPNPLVFTSTVSPVSLPTLNTVQANMLPLENEQGTIVGFGFVNAASTARADFLMRAFQRVIPNARCQQHFQITLPQHFCGEDTTDISNVCNGDLGAGFITDVRGRPTVTGIASLITQSCGNTAPTGYTRVESYRQWITSVTQI
ncbi:AAEL009682-PA [Aedes aegypti]|uniref:AAEL009682-PA n=2 Tax=Aedes aegypti TaxID=7159 RepID=A0A1S4FN29_AEDAE|nr:vitamin K-dependent protein C [Aedes aegypti]EAT38416.1 AAEL009682-PA [Aedes aegypti]